MKMETMNLKSKMITVRYFLNGDESGQLYTTCFDNSAEYEEFVENYDDAIEIFSVEGE